MGRIEHRLRARIAPPARTDRSNKPRANFTRSTRRTASSTTDSGTLARAHQLRQRSPVQAALHVHVHAGEDGFLCGRGWIIGHTLRDQFGYRIPIAHYEALKAPFVAQNVGQRHRVRACRHAVEWIECAHHCCRATIDRRLKWRQINLPQGALGNVRCIVFAAGLRLLRSQPDAWRTPPSNRDSPDCFPDSRARKPRPSLWPR